MEEWKAIPGYEGLYEASNLGRIRTAAGKTTSNARYPKRVWKQRIMSPKYKVRRCSKKLDAQVTLWNCGNEKMFLVSRLVAMTWCDGYAEGLTVNHIDGDTLNNVATNLEWISLAENIRHGFENGLYKQNPCTLVNTNGEMVRFPSYASASRAIGRPNRYVSDCIRNNKPIVSASGEPYGIA